MSKSNSTQGNDPFKNLLNLPQRNAKNTTTPPNYQSPVISKEVKKRMDELADLTDQIEHSYNNQQFVAFNNDNYYLNYKTNLNPAQLHAVTNIDGPLLVIAGAGTGTGKTKTIIYRVAFMLEINISPDQILLLTFPRKAAKEMKERVGKLLGDNQSINITGGTFHSYANYLLRKYSNLITF